MKLAVQKNVIKKILICIVAVIIFALLLFYFFCPFIIDYENVEEHIHINDENGYLTVICDYGISSVNYLAKSDGTRYICLAPDGEGRCYRQSIQITTNRWNMIFGHSTAVYQRELTDYGAVSGESIIINEDETTMSVSRYDIEIYYRNSNNTEYLIWSLE